MAKSNTLTEVEKFAIVGMKKSGMTVPQIKEELTRPEKSRVVENFLRDYVEEDVQQISMQDPTDRDQVNKALEDWGTAIEEALEQLVKRDVDPGVAKQIVHDAMKRVDLDSDPSVDTVLSFANDTNVNLMSVKKHGNSSVISMNQGSAIQATESKDTVRPGQPRSQRGAIFNPKKSS